MIEIKFTFETTEDAKQCLKYSDYISVSEWVRNYLRSKEKYGTLEEAQFASKMREELFNEFWDLLN